MNETAKINELINEPDVLEIVRDQVAAILSLELQNQYAMAQAQAVPNAKDFDIRFFVENSRPFEASGDKPFMRFVNVQLSKVAVLPGNPRMGDQKETATILIDCCGCGNDSGDFRDDKSAAFRSWKIARIVRRILMSDAYLYLGLRGTVGSRFVTALEAGEPVQTELQKESALAFGIVRITMEVTFMERSIQTDGPPLEIISYELVPESGEIIAN